MLKLSSRGSTHSGCDNRGTRSHHRGLTCRHRSPDPPGSFEPAKQAMPEAHRRAAASPGHPESVASELHSESS